MSGRNECSHGLVWSSDRGNRQQISNLAERALERSSIGLTQGTRKLLALAESHMATHLSQLRASAFQATFARDTRLSEATASPRSGTLHRVRDGLVQLEQHAQTAHVASERTLTRRLDRLESLTQRLRLPRYGRVIDAAANRLTQQERRLDALKPEHVLRRCYALVRDADGQPVTSIHGLRPGQPLTTTLADGSIASRVDSTEEATPPANPSTTPAASQGS